MEQKINYTDVFVDTLYTLANTGIPPEILAEARKCLLDGIGSLIAGTGLMRERVEKYLSLQPDCPDGATVAGMGRRASLQNAALSNSLSLHVCEMDDGHRFSTVHLAATVIPAVLAVGEYYHLTMADLLRGMVIGYETSIRMGRCVQPAHRARGYHSSGTVGTLGAAMGVAAALKFSREEMKAALSAAATSAGGLNEMMENVSTMKPFNPGRACHDGITAALIAKSGFVGPHDSISGNFSFFRAMCETCDPTGLDLKNDPNWNITGGYHKVHASCRHTHAPIDGALDIVRKEHPDVAQIDRILVEMYGQGIKGHDQTEISTPVAGKQSTPFCVGLALAQGSAGMSDFTQENVDNETVMHLCCLTEVKEDPALSALVPKQRPARVTIFLKDGTSFVKMVDYARGEPENPLSMEDFLEKFMDLASTGGKSREEAEKIAEVILHHEGEVSALTTLLA